MNYKNRKEAHRAMIRQAEREFLRTLQLPHLTLVENPSSGRFSISHGEPPIEEGMTRLSGEIKTTRQSH